MVSRFISGQKSLVNDLIKLICSPGSRTSDDLLSISSSELSGETLKSASDTLIMLVNADKTVLSPIKRKKSALLHLKAT